MVTETASEAQAAPLAGPVPVISPLLDGGSSQRNWATGDPNELAHPVVNSLLAHACRNACGKFNRLIEVWNGIPGLTPVKKFTDRKSAVGRIWKAIQSLDGGGATEAAMAPERASKPKAGGKKGKKAKSATKRATKAAKGKRAKGSDKPAVARDGSKKAEVLGLLQRKGGATLAQIMKATGWQAHSVRGFISGALGKKMGLTVNSVRREDGERVYSIA